MKSMKRVLACAVFVVPLVAMAACGDESSNSGATPVPTTAPTTTSTTPPPDAAPGADTGSDTGTDTGTDSAPQTFTIRGTVTNASNAGLVLQLNGGNDVSVAANATMFSFTTKLADQSAYVVTIKTLPNQQACRVQAGSGIVPGADVTNVAIDCSHRTSCKQLHADIPLLPSGAYIVDPDAAGAIAPLAVECDMTFNDGAGGGAGGWTMILSTANKKAPSTLTAGPVLSGSEAYLPLATMQSFANAATQVHLRTKGLAATESITSKANNEIIANLRLGNLANEGLAALSAADKVDRWTGPFANTARLDFSGATNSQVWPSVYWANSNNVGLHLVTTNSVWTFANGDPNANVDMEVYLR
jgi:hypothetical protein